MGMTDSAALNDALQDYYTEEEVTDTSFEEGGPLFSMMPKKTDFAGRKFVVPTQFGLPQGRSATFSKAKANKTKSYYDAFEITMASDFATHSISRKALLESRDQKHAFFDAQVREIDGMIKQLTRSAALGLFRGTSGSMGQYSTSSGTTITLKDPDDITNFEVGQVLTLAANETSGSERVGTMTVTGITDYTLGKFTVDAVIAGATLNDHIFIEGDRNNKMTGVLAWVPPSTPSATLFHGVDRTQHEIRLAGHRLTATTVPITEAIRRIVAQIRKTGGHPTHAFCSTNKYRDAELELENKVQYTTTNVTANVGFTGIVVVSGGKSKVTLYEDFNCPEANIPVLKLDEWELASLGPVPSMVDDDGVTMLREATESAFEVRAEYYANPGCHDLRAQGTLTVE